ncbi:MAG: GtrA family protein [Ottowia sp.]|uniref:GtrA family protein n=1 Tax=Ottowia sp. TaxID=1898956 RepID=UPI0039E6DD0D
MIAREALRYVLAGGANTLATYALYLVLLRAMHYRWAYLLAFAAGIGLSFLLLRHLVFARPGKRFSLAYVAASHGVQLALGLAVVEAWVAWLRGPAWLAPLAAAAVCVPVMFALQRWIFTPHAAR